MVGLQRRPFFVNNACIRLEKNSFGEQSAFRNGMSVSDLMRHMLLTIRIEISENGGIEQGIVTIVIGFLVITSITTILDDRPMMTFHTLIWTRHWGTFTELGNQPEIVYMLVRIVQQPPMYAINKILKP
jgi:hypothetical protein